MRHAFPILMLLCLLAGCGNSGNRPAEPSKYDSEVRKAYLQYYGAYYAAEGLPQKVYALDCYSDGLLLNKQGVIEGSGTNLYFSDIFVADSLTGLPAGTYTADTTGAPMTFLPGQTYESQISGAYLLLIEEGQLSDYAILTKGTLTVAYEGETAVVHFEGTTSKKKTYTADFRGVFTREDKSGDNKIKQLPRGAVL